VIYIHIPFCRSFCTYCDFFSELCPKNLTDEVQNRLFDNYCNSILLEIRKRSREIALTRRSYKGSPDTLYIGGGTPSIFPAERLGRIMDALGPGGYRECTLEVNPDDVNSCVAAEKWKGLGVTRISMGVQSFDDDILRWMNRRHTAADAAAAFALLRKQGFNNISIDLIFGISHLTDDTWQESIEAALQLHPEHISAYQLSIEDGSALAGMVADGRYTPAPDEQCRRQYDLLCNRLRRAGYLHYEISNWALPGFESIHNSAYWKRVPYVGLGPGAHSFQMEGEVQRRLWNSCSLEGWEPSSEILSLCQCREEQLMLALRTSAGLPFSEIDACSNAHRMLEDGVLVTGEDGNVRIPEDRFFVSDDIIEQLI